MTHSGHNIKHSGRSCIKIYEGKDNVWVGPVATLVVHANNVALNENFILIISQTDLARITSMWILIINHNLSILLHGEIL